jgi:hypothetical protein
MDKIGDFEKKNLGHYGLRIEHRWTHNRIWMEHMDFEETNYFWPYGLRRQHRWIENRIRMECGILKGEF